MRYLLVLALIMLMSAVCPAKTPAENELPPAATNQVRFSSDIRPVLEASCLNCHGHGRVKGGFQLDTRDTTLRGGDSGPAVIPGNSRESLLIHLVSGLDPDSIMPQKGKPLTPEQIGLLRAWIDQGVAWDQGANFARRSPANLKPRKPELPSSAQEKRNPIDQILQAYFKGHNIPTPSLVDDRTFARRAYADIIGLLPTPDEMKVFLADTSPDKRARLAQKLLSDNENYAQHWLTFWNDLLRNDYTGTGYIDGGRKQITQWLYSALLTNMPYDRFVAQLVNPGPENEGFVKGIVWRGVVNASQTPQMQAAQNISQVFMGVNIKCASCHDSFINEWKLSDAYGLAAVYHDGPLEMFECDKPTGKTVSASFIYPELGSIEPGGDKTARLQRLADILSSPANGRLPRTIINRLWGQFFGYALVEPVDDMEQSAWNQDLLDWLAEDLASGGYDLKRTIETIVTSQAYQLPSVNLTNAAPSQFVFRGPLVRRLAAEQFRDAVGQVTGVWMEKSRLGGVTNHIRAALTPADPLTLALGRPNREQVVTRRSSEATTLRALELTNGRTLAGVLAKGADNLARLGSPPSQLVTSVYQRALSREPTASELAVSLELVGNGRDKHGIEDLLWAITMLPEFQLVH